MKIVIDDAIPFIREAIGLITPDATYLRGSSIAPQDVRDADALIVRTRTRCGRQLLEGSSVRFVGTATIGTDHLDTEWMENNGITWANCPGCNAGSVAQYVETSMLRFQMELPGVRLEGMTAGIVGLGHVGAKVKEALERLGMRTIVNDPPKAPLGAVGLEEMAREADVISFHVPLTRSGPHPTWHLAGRDFFRTIGKRTPIIINTSRGGVVDEAALLEAMNEGRIGGAIIDTWEGEPNINLELLDKAFIATPHIAGYSADGKVTADNMIIEALCHHFGIKRPPAIPFPNIEIRKDAGPLDLYDPMEDCMRLRANPGMFEELRSHYPLRRERAD